MTPRSFLVEAVVGELLFVAFPATRPPPSPTVAIHVVGGPPLYIPFLAPASIHPSPGHSLDQPTTGTESGKFVFQRGKSCVFSAPGQLIGGEVKVQVLDGHLSPPSILGWCDTHLMPKDGAYRVLQRKLTLVDSRGEAVAHLTLALTCRCLGEEVLAGDFRGNVQGGTFSPGSAHISLTPSDQLSPRSVATSGGEEDVWKVWQISHLCSPLPEKQPPPIIYPGPEEGVARRQWEEKLSLFVGRADAVPMGMPQEEMHSDDSQPIGTPDTPSSHTRRRRRKRRSKRAHAPPKENTNQVPAPLAKPKGWLRSTPPAPPQPRQTPHPRPTRTHILRLARVEPQIAHHLEAEVNRRVKERLKCLDEDFFAQMQTLRTHRKVRSAPATPLHHALQTVGCQTEGAKDLKVPLQLDGLKLGHHLRSGSFQHRLTSPCTSQQDNRMPTPHRTHYRSQSPSPHASEHTPPSRCTSHYQSPSHHLPTPDTSHSHPYHTPPSSHSSSPHSSHSYHTPSPLHKSTSHSHHTSLPPSQSPTDRATSSCTPIQGAGVRHTPKLSLGQMPKNLTYVIERQDDFDVSPPSKECQEENSSSPLPVPASQQHQNRVRSQGSGDSSAGQFLDPPKSGEVLREPSQDTGLTYTVQGRAESPEALYSVQSCNSDGICKSVSFSAPKSKSKSESECSEVEEESGLSAEVCKEIFRGRQADFLTRAGSHALDNNPQSIGESLLSPSDHSESRKESKDASVDLPQTSLGVAGIPESRGGSAGEGSSISDISAKIAALLVARRVSIKRRNTESISSYLPSGQQDDSSLSDLSDLLSSP